MRGRHVRGADGLRKSRNSRAAGRKILIVTEGVRTEPQYFEGLAKNLNARAVYVTSVKSVGLGKDPLSVVKEAISRRSNDKRIGDPFDEVWCVVDVDQHASLEDACSLARREGISLAVSSPCFEIWLIWHYSDHFAWISTAGALEKLKSKHGFTGKILPDNFPFGAHEDAIRRADGCAPVSVPHKPPNPHSSVARLVESMINSITRRGK
ncbi:RloB family protein [Kitasatospora purpeofusca]|uniref:RloB family protein n=1 Tax=Kitasatospora purpeofusca TaxID=67352 RepID=UPI0035E0E96F